MLRTEAPASNPLWRLPNGRVNPESGTPLLQGLQFLARLKPNRLSWRDRNFGTGPGISSDPGLARAHVEDTKPPELNPITFAQSFLHRLEDCFHGHLRLGLRDSRAAYDFVDDVELDQTASLSPIKRSSNRSSVPAKM